MSGRALEVQFGDVITVRDLDAQHVVTALQDEPCISTIHQKGGEEWLAAGGTLNGERISLTGDERWTAQRVLEGVVKWWEKAGTPLHEDNTAIIAQTIQDEAQKPPIVYEW